MATQAPDGLTVEVDVHAVIEAAAVLYAIGDLLAVAVGDGLLTELAEQTATELLTGAGALPFSDEDYSRDPLVVAALARAGDLTAERAQRLAKYAADRAADARLMRRTGDSDV